MSVYLKFPQSESISFHQDFVLFLAICKAAIITREHVLANCFVSASVMRKSICTLKTLHVDRRSRVYIQLEER